jgi:hypothetical protein
MPLFFSGTATLPAFQGQFQFIGKILIEEANSE